MNKMPDKSPCCDWPVVSLKGKDGQGYTMCPQCCEHLSKCCGAEIEAVHMLAQDGYVEFSIGIDHYRCTECHEPCHRPVETPKEES